MNYLSNITTISMRGYLRQHAYQRLLDATSRNQAPSGGELYRNEIFPNCNAQFD